MTATLAPTLGQDDPAYFDRLAGIDEVHWWSLGMWRLAAHWLDGALTEKRGLSALDVGCGTGATALRLARREEIARVVGLDPSPAALAHARQRHEFPLILGSALALPFEAGSFDVLTCFDVLQHLPDGGDRRAMVECARVLAPGGVVVFRSNARGWSDPPRGTGPCYTLAALVALATRAGLVVERATRANCLPALAQEVRGRLARDRRLSAHPAGGGLRIQCPSHRMNRLMLRVTTAEALLAGRLGARLPFGHSTLILARKPFNTNHKGTKGTKGTKEDTKGKFIK